MNAQPSLPEIPPKPARTIRTRKAVLFGALADAADALIHAKGLILQCVIALRHTTALETERDELRAENEKLRADLSRLSAPWWARVWRIWK